VAGTAEQLHQRDGEHGADQRERRELRRPEVADDRRVDEQVQRLGRERAERRQGEPEDLAVVGGAAQQGADSTIRP